MNSFFLDYNADVVVNKDGVSKFATEVDLQELKAGKKFEARMPIGVEEGGFSSVQVKEDGTVLQDPL